MKLKITHYDRKYSLILTCTVDNSNGINLRYNKNKLFIFNR